MSLTFSLIYVNLPLASGSPQRLCGHPKRIYNLASDSIQGLIDGCSEQG